jgi:hypothetical protein
MFPSPYSDAGDLTGCGNINSHNIKAPELHCGDLLDGQRNFRLGASLPADT